MECFNRALRVFRSVKWSWQLWGWWRKGGSVSITLVIALGESALREFPRGF